MSSTLAFLDDETVRHNRPSPPQVVFDLSVFLGNRKQTRTGVSIVTTEESIKAMEAFKHNTG